MKKVVFVFMLVIATCVQSYAQNPKSRLTSGIIALDAQRTDEALEKIQFAIDNVDLLKEKDRPKAYYYYAKVLIAAASDSSLSGTIPDALVKADEALTKAKASDKYKKVAVLDEEPLWAACFNEGASAYNENDYKTSISRFQIATRLKPEDINTNLMMGYSYWLGKDTTEAQNAWKKVTELYASADKTEPNNDVANAYLLLAGTYDIQGNAKEALKYVSEGRNLFPSDEDLAKTELNIYQKSPELFEEAVKKFEVAITNNPDDLNLKMAYASLLQNNEKDEKAMALYREVLQSDPDHLNANIQVGAHYVNQAAEINTKKMEMKDDDEIDKATADVQALLKKAFPFMQKLHKMEPNEPEWINQIVNIAYYIELPEDQINAYVKKQQEVMSKARQ